MLSAVHCSDTSTMQTALLFFMGLDMLRSSPVYVVYVIGYTHTCTDLAPNIKYFCYLYEGISLLVVTLLRAEIRVKPGNEWDEG